MNAYLLDTSAILAHCLGEAGSARVQALFDDEDAALWLAAPSLLELDTALRSRGVSVEERCRVLDRYGTELLDIVSMDEVVARRAIAIRDATATRLPTIDALIAACAAICGAVLVHRDAHFDAIPEAVLARRRLSREDDAEATSADVRNAVKETRPRYRARRGRPPRNAKQ